MATLRAGDRPFAEAFDVLLRSAPQDRLDAILARLDGGGAAAPSPNRGRLQVFAAAAAAVLLLLVGGVAGYLLPRPAEEAAAEHASSDGWRQVVAEYLTLYTSDTLASIPDDAALRAHELATVGARLSLALDAGKVALPDLVLKRAQVFALDGRPLAQIAYLSQKDGPIAFCIIADGESDQPPRFEQRLGSNIVFWSRDGHGYMLLGKAPRETLEALAATLAERVS